MLTQKQMDNQTDWAFTLGFISVIVAVAISLCLR